MHLLGYTLPAVDARNSDFGFLKLRYKRASSYTSELISLPITDGLAKPVTYKFSREVRFSVAVAIFGGLLGAPCEARYSFDDDVSFVQTARGDGPLGYRAELLNLARLAKSARP
jgi:Ca-activated chloride channel homolog